MFEPLSALTCISFAIGTLSFLVNTVSKIDERVGEMHECETRLRSFYWQLQEGHLKLSAWRAIWLGRKPFSDKTYIHCWGLETFESIQCRIKDIIKLSEEIKTILRVPLGLNEEESLIWAVLTNRDHIVLAEERPREHEKIKLTEEIGFTLFRNNTLREKIDRFKSEIEGLELVCQLSYRMRQHRDPNKTVTRDELLELSKMKRFMNDVSDFACTLYTSQRSEEQHMRWALELTPPAAEQTPDPWNESDTVYLGFFIRSVSQDHQRRAKRFRVYILGDSIESQSSPIMTFSKIQEIILDGVDAKPRHAPGQLFSLLEEPNSRSKPVSTGQLWTLLEDPKSRSKPFRKMLNEGVFSGPNRKSFEVERAELAFGLAHWVIMLWSTPWSRRLCSCGIRCIHLVKSGTSHAFDSNIGRPHWAPECHPSDLANKRLLLLGVALAEIALATPLCVKAEGPSFRFLLGETWITERSLADILRKKCGRDTITKAIRYCLDQEDEEPDDLGPEDFADHRRNILLPLQKYFHVVTKYSASLSGKRLRRREEVDNYYDENKEETFLESRSKTGIGDTL